MRYIKFGFVLICLFMFAQGTDAHPRPSGWGEGSEAQWERETKQENNRRRTASERRRRTAEERNSRASDSRVAQAQSLDIYVPEKEYTPVMYKFLKGEPLTVLIWQSARNKRRDYADSVKAAFDSWFTHARLYIGRRSGEFADVMPLLNRKILINVNYTVGEAKVLPPGDSLSINIFDTLERVQKECENRNAVGCMAPLEKDRLIIMYKDDPEFQTTLEHELGHVLGLIDEYGEERELNTRHKSKRRPENRRRGGSIMAESTRIQCDDVDGLINIIDLWNGCSSARAQNGWDSLCGDGTRYKCGEDITKAPRRPRRK